MLFILIYFPCIGVIATIRKESGRWKYALFEVGYTTGLAWLVSFAVYQLGSLLIG
jgi:ferrous iron transport protein B